MAKIVWTVVEKIYCDRIKAESELLEERVYHDDPVPDVGQPFQVRARKCSAGLDCNLAGYNCQYSFTNPNYDPFAR